MPVDSTAYLFTVVFHYPIFELQKILNYHAETFGIRCTIPREVCGNKKFLVDINSTNLISLRFHNVIRPDMGG